MIVKWPCKKAAVVEKWRKWRGKARVFFRGEGPSSLFRSSRHRLTQAKGPTETTSERPLRRASFSAHGKGPSSKPLKTSSGGRQDECQWIPIELVLFTSIWPTST